MVSGPRPLPALPAIVCRSGRAWRMGVLIVGSVLSSLSPVSTAHADVSKEVKVKGAFVFNFVKYVDWPAETFRTEEDAIVIGVLERSPVGKVLRQIVREKTVGGRLIVVREIRLDDPSTLDGCHVVYLSDTEGRDLHAALKRVRGRPVLTIGDHEDVFSTCGVIRFVKEGTKIRFEICRASAALQELELSARVLRLAALVHCECGSA